MNRNNTSSDSVLQTVSKLTGLVAARKGIGTRLKDKYAMYGLGRAGGCGGCGQTAEKLNNMTPEQAEQLTDELLAEMAGNMHSSRDAVVAVARSITTQQFQTDFMKKRLKAAIAEQAEEDDVLATRLEQFLSEHGSVDPAVIQFVHYLITACGKETEHGGTEFYGDQGQASGDDG